ncbi:TPA: FRG domain-containing protein [Legionella pneumophila]|uniref:FRG domain-containing protein n=1 Tax=Legionella pneumophila TaxID=446 RepID=UPI0007772A85|nr:FRG domain-containing protein [Legionella pneumophila]
MDIKEDWVNKIHCDALEIEKWEDFIEFINSNEDALKGCLYRGQRDSNWKLRPSFFRLINNHSSEDIIQRLYNQQLEQFKLHTRGRHAISYDSPFDDDLVWWSLGQHYGLATPLLDWVRSPYVATFFSFLKDRINSACQPSKRAIYIFDYNEFKKIENIGNGSQSNYIEKVNTLTHDNARLVSQQGELIYISPINQTKNQTIERVLENFSKDFNVERPLLLKVILLETERSKILYRLDQMNINQSTLFGSTPTKGAL